MTKFPDLFGVAVGVPRRTMMENIAAIEIPIPTEIYEQVKGILARYGIAQNIK